MTIETSKTHHIVTFGRTGAGKSWCGNRLLKNDHQQLFKEDDSDESCTANITSHIAFNDDLISDIPGYFDSAGRDNIQQANFVDYLKNKSIRAILFLYTDRADLFTKNVLEAFKSCGLQNNIILVKNKVISPPSVEVETFLDSTKISIMVNQNNLDVLKQIITNMTPVMVSHLVAPASLFRQPLEIVREEIVNEFVEDRQIPVKVRVSEQVIVQVPREIKTGAIQGWVGGALGIDGRKTIYEPETRTIFKDQMVPKPHKVFNRVKYTYAMRFDNVADICKRDILEVVTVELK